MPGIPSTTNQTSVSECSRRETETKKRAHTRSTTTVLQIGHCTVLLPGAVLALIPIASQHVYHPSSPPAFSARKQQQPHRYSIPRKAPNDHTAEPACPQSGYNRPRTPNPPSSATPRRATRRPRPASQRTAASGAACASGRGSHYRPAGDGARVP